jgi:hypothetical protein
MGASTRAEADENRGHELDPDYQLVMQQMTAPPRSGVSAQPAVDSVDADSREEEPAWEPALPGVLGGETGDVPGSTRAAESPGTRLDRPSAWSDAPRETGPGGEDPRPTASDAGLPRSGTPFDRWLAGREPERKPAEEEKATEESGESERSREREQEEQAPELGEGEQPRKPAARWNQPPTGGPLPPLMSRPRTTGIRSSEQAATPPLQSPAVGRFLPPGLPLGSPATPGMGEGGTVPGLPAVGSAPRGRRASTGIRSGGTGDTGPLQRSGGRFSGRGIEPTMAIPPGAGNRTGPPGRLPLRGPIAAPRAGPADGISSPTSGPGLTPWLRPRPSTGIRREEPSATDR